jgi:hypothetical protein
MLRRITLALVLAISALTSVSAFARGTGATPDDCVEGYDDGYHWRCS